MARLFFSKRLLSGTKRSHASLSNWNEHLCDKLKNKGLPPILGVPRFAIERFTGLQLRFNIVENG